MPSFSGRSRSAQVSGQAWLPPVLLCAAAASSLASFRRAPWSTWTLPGPFGADEVAQLGPRWATPALRAKPPRPRLAVQEWGNFSPARFRQRLPEAFWKKHGQALGATALPIARAWQFLTVQNIWPGPAPHSVIRSPDSPIDAWMPKGSRKLLWMVLVCCSIAHTRSGPSSLPGPVSFDDASKEMQPAS